MKIQGENNIDYLLLNGAGSLISWQFQSWSRNFSPFVELEIYLPFSQEMSTGLYVEPRKTTIRYQYLFKVTFNIFISPRHTLQSNIDTSYVMWLLTSVCVAFSILSEQNIILNTPRIQELFFNVLVVYLMSSDDNAKSASVTLSPKDF